MNSALTRHLVVTILMLVLGQVRPALAAPFTASTDDAPAREVPGLHADVEVDPTAYVLSGYSLHAGIGVRKLRVDLGAFAMALPDFVHGNEGFDASFNGYGLKTQYFVFTAQRGLFVGADAGLARLTVKREHSASAGEQKQVSLGVNAGYRFVLPAGFYVTTWLGVSYGVGARDLHLEGHTFSVQPWTVFPAVHVGYRLL